jgi:hypothetical protein
MQNSPKAKKAAKTRAKNALLAGSITVCLPAYDSMRAGCDRAQDGQFGVLPSRGPASATRIAGDLDREWRFGHASAQATSFAPYEARWKYPYEFSMR